jgi:predicted amidophosphoribosyltransferase
MTWHTEDCGDSFRCNGKCHEVHLDCSNCGSCWDGEDTEEPPDVCEECGEPWSDGDESENNYREDFHADG